MGKDYSIKLSAKIEDSAKTVSELNKQISNLEKKIKSLELKVDTGKTEKVTKGFGDLNEQLTKLKINMEDFNKVSSSQTATTALTKYTDNAGRTVTINQKLINGAEQYKVTLREQTKEINKNTKAASIWGVSWKQAFQNFVTYRLVQKSFDAVLSGLEDMVTQVINLDDKLTELKKVTDLEGESLDNFVKKSYAAAETVAKTGSEMVEATTEFAKAGYDEDQSLELGRIALMYTNIADEAVSAGEAANFIIAQMKAFNIEAEDSMHIIDAVDFY